MTADRVLVRREAIVVPLEDLRPIVAVVRMGAAALAAMPMAPTAAADQMLRTRTLRVARELLDELDPEYDGDD